MSARASTAARLRRAIAGRVSGMMYAFVVTSVCCYLAGTVCFLSAADRSIGTGLAIPGQMASLPPQSGVDIDEPHGDLPPMTVLASGPSEAWGPFGPPRDPRLRLGCVAVLIGGAVALCAASTKRTFLDWV